MADTIKSDKTLRSILYRKVRQPESAIEMQLQDSDIDSYLGYNNQHNSYNQYNSYNSHVNSSKYKTVSYNKLFYLCCFIFVVLCIYYAIYLR
jgi:hypothetical protein